jgi:uncharacterized protein (DUF1697 family)
MGHLESLRLLYYESMPTYILLLRGVMPSGKNRVPMARLREVLAAAGFDNVRTYLQSGNALVGTELSATAVEIRVHDLIKEHIGPDLTVVARTSSELRAILDRNPFQEGYDIARVFFVVFAQVPAVERIGVLLAQDFGDEQLAIVEEAAYMYIPGAYGRHKLSNNFLEGKLKVRATMRNFNTLSKLVELGKGPADRGAS